MAPSSQTGGGRIDTEHQGQAQGGLSSTQFINSNVDVLMKLIGEKRTEFVTKDKYIGYQRTFNSMTPDQKTKKGINKGEEGRIKNLLKQIIEKLEEQFLGSDIYDIEKGTGIIYKTEDLYPYFNQEGGELPSQTQEEEETYGLQGDDEEGLEEQDSYDY